jgi:hypothetical protein
MCIVFKNKFILMTLGLVDSIRVLVIKIFDIFHS